MPPAPPFLVQLCRPARIAATAPAQRLAEIIITYTPDDPAAAAPPSPSAATAAKPSWRHQHLATRWSGRGRLQRSAASAPAQHERRCHYLAGQAQMALMHDELLAALPASTRLSTWLPACRTNPASSSRNKPLRASVVPNAEGTSASAGNRHGWTLTSLANVPSSPWISRPTRPGPGPPRVRRLAVARASSTRSCRRSASPCGRDPPPPSVLLHPPAESSSSSSCGVFLLLLLLYYTECLRPSARGSIRTSNGWLSS